MTTLWCCMCLHRLSGIRCRKPPCHFCLARQAMFLLSCLRVLIASCCYYITTSYLLEHRWCWHHWECFDRHTDGVAWYSASYWSSLIALARIVYAIVKQITNIYLKVDIINRKRTAAPPSRISAPLRSGQVGPARPPPSRRPPPRGFAQKSITIKTTTYY